MADEIDRTRALVQWAFSERGGVSGSVSETFCGRRTVDSRLKPSRRTTGLSATRVHAVESAKARQSRVPIASGRSGGEVLRAVGSLSALHRHWVYYVYHPNVFQKIKAVKHLKSLLWNRYQDKTDLKGVHQRSKQLAYAMLHMQLDAASSYGQFLQWRPSRPRELADRVSLQSWSDTHGDRWEDIRHMLVRVDTEAMMLIRVAMDNTRHGARLKLDGCVC